MIVLNERRRKSAERLASLANKLPESTKLAAGKACVYVTGSFARGEASDHSDLDLFMVGKCEPEDEPKRLLTRLDEICVKAELISVTRAEGIPDFSGDGQYLAFYTVRELVASLGSPADDATNTFTARLLLLLESRPLVETSVYAEVIQEVILPYWRDFEDHRDDFMPAFLANDILRLWRTFCVNYEARTETDPREKKAKRKLKNYKLKHSRLLTCYSALLFLLATYKSSRTVTPKDVVEMTQLSPVKRLEWLTTVFPQHSPEVEHVLAQYADFLLQTNADEGALVERFLDQTDSQRLMQGAYTFGSSVFELLEKVGTNGDGSRDPFYRCIVV